MSKLTKYQQEYVDHIIHIIHLQRWADDHNSVSLEHFNNDFNESDRIALFNSNKDRFEEWYCRVTLSKEKEIK